MKDFDLIIPEALRPYLEEYCYKCGTKVILTRRWHHGYDEGTGKKEYMYLIECPKRLRWWNVLFSLHARHEYLVCVPKPLFRASRREKIRMHTTVLERRPY